MTHTTKIRVKSNGRIFDVPCEAIDEVQDINLEKAGLSEGGVGKGEYDAWLFKREYDVLPDEPEVVEPEGVVPEQEFEVTVKVAGTVDLSLVLYNIPEEFLKNTTVDTK